MSDEKKVKDGKNTEPKGEVNEHVILEALLYQQGGMRRGTAKQKTRSEVSGGGVKPWRQKGTGRARQGSTRAVQWRGGGRAFGSSRRNYVVKMNKKARQSALQSLMAAKKAEGRVLIEELHYDTPSTRQFAEFLSGKEITGKVLFIYSADTDKNSLKSAKNLPEVTLLHVDKLNIKDLLNSDWLLLCQADAAKIKGLQTVESSQ